MKIKSLLLGTAAAVVMTAGAQAADLPTAAPVEYVKVCDAFGSGFFYIPGSDTCLKIGGFVRADYYIAENHWGNNRPFFPAAINLFGGETDGSGNDTYSTRIRAQFDFDARTQTDWGPIRTYIRVRTENRSDKGADAAYAYYAFVQFAGITAGYAQSFFDFFVLGGRQLGNYMESDNITPLLAYTYTAPTGFYATLSLEDANFNQNTTYAGDLDINTNINSAKTISHARYEAPDVVVALGVNQSWGRAQLAGALGQINVTNGVTSEQEMRWAVRGGIDINLPSLSQGAKVGLTAAYGVGAPRYVVGTSLPVGYAEYGASANANEFGFEPLEMWSVGAGISHYWTPTLRSSAYVYYAEIDWDAQYKLNNTQGQYAENLLYATANLVWTPVSKLNIGLELIYGRVEGFTSATPVTGYVANTSRDEDAFGAMFRIQRSF